MVPRSLQEDLLRIPGVEGAEVEGTGEQPAGLRIRIAAGADQSAVGSAIRRVLTEHGLGTDTRLPGEGSQGDPAGPAVVEAQADVELPDEPQVETEAAVENGSVAVLEDVDTPAPVIDLTDDDEPTEAASTAEPVVPANSEPVEVPFDRETVAMPAANEERAGEPSADAPVAEPAAPREPAGEPQRSPAGLARIESVGVEEGRDGILVTVASSDGEAVRQIASSTEGGVEAAVVKATARLADPEAPDPVVVDIADRRISGVDIVMIVLDADGTISAGSSVVAAGRSFALGRATWAALSL